MACFVVVDAGVVVAAAFAVESRRHQADCESLGSPHWEVVDRDPDLGCMVVVLASLLAWLVVGSFD